MRIDKLLAHAGYGTRKEVRKLLRAKQVKVDDNTITNQGFHVDPNSSVITVSGDEVHYQKYVYLMLNKPADYITATYDPYDVTVIDLVPLEYSHFQLSPVGRLDKDTEGLLLLTNDGKLNHVLTSPKSNIWKTYEANVLGKVTGKHVEQFKQGVTLDDGYQTKEAVLEIVNETADESTIRLSITEGKFHQVKRMFRAIGMEVIYLRRTHVGSITLDEQLPLGGIRHLNKTEMQWIHNIKEGE